MAISFICLLYSCIFRQEMKNYAPFKKISACENKFQLASTPMIHVLTVMIRTQTSNHFIYFQLLLKYSVNILETLI